MKKIFAILIGLFFVGSVFGVASVMAPPPDNTTYINPNKLYYNVGENVIVTSNGGYDALETPNGVLSYVSSEWNPTKGILTMTWKAEKTGIVEFYSDYTSILIKVGIDKPTPMFSFMKILGFGKKK